MVHGIEKRASMQKKIENFFTVKIAHSKTIKQCFIYDPSIPQATFVYEPQDMDQFLTTESGIKLYYRPSSQSSKASFPTIDLCEAPLLISNLQKAIRRGDSIIAVQSALALVQQHPTKLFRRLPIIYIEDVMLLDSFPIVVWWMMADKEYQLTNIDVDYLLNIIHNLATQETYYENDRETETPPHSHCDLQSYPNADALLALHYRSMYGGMKGDMRMLANAIPYYMKHDIKSTVYHGINESISCTIEILMESIDFHPFPQLLSILHHKTKIEKERLKECIWYAESGINIRKPDTIEVSQQYQEKWEWKAISKFIDGIRHQLIS